MTGTKVALIILGVLLIIGGVYCIFMPGATFATLAPLCGIAMIFDGIGNICSWNDARKAGQSDGWLLVGAIISLLAGIFMLTNIFVSLLVDAMLTYFIIFWLIVMGIIRIAAAFKIRKAGQYVDERMVRHGYSNPKAGKGWGWVLAFGILMILVGVFGLVSPMIIVLTVGYIIGFCVIAAGFSMISLSATI